MPKLPRAAQNLVSREGPSTKNIPTIVLFKISLSQIITSANYIRLKVSRPILAADMEGAQKFVETTINSKPVVVFSKTYCPFCVKVKKLFQDEIKVPADKMTVVEIEDMPDCSAIQAVLKDITGASSVPRVFIKGKSIGGCDDTFKRQDNGELKSLLDEALA